MKTKRCDACCFSKFAVGPGRPVLLCYHRQTRDRRLRIRRLTDSCADFYPTTNFKLSLSLNPRPAPRPIPLTNGQFAVVDSEDYDHLSSFTWHAVKSCDTYYAARRKGPRKIFMHRQITNAPANLIVDHIDHNGLNNKKSNLRLCKQDKNILNSRPTKGKSSKYKGVQFSKFYNRFIAIIFMNGRKHFLGKFDNEIDAARAYDAKARQLFGEYAYLNFPK